MNRAEMVQRAFADGSPWDMLIIGGGSTGVGVAVDAASRGYRILLIEQSDFGKATSSRSTKLIHGGVRYLRQGRIPLVIESLRERRALMANAPHLVHDMAFIVPAYQRGDRLFYGAGMKLYDLLAAGGGGGLPRSRILSKKQVLKRIPTLAEPGLRGGVEYHDAQFDDARLLINLVQTAADHGATLVNYCACVGLSRDPAGRVTGAVLRDVESGEQRTVRARCVVNATGAFTDALVKMAEPNAPPMIAPSQGTHLVLDRNFLPGEAAIMVPRTSDGRVMFAIPWHGYTLLGTTDTPIERVSLEPRPLEQEVAFILDAAGRYLSRPPTRADVLSAFAGIRPLVRGDEQASTANLSREHTLHVSRTGLLSIFGGKWTTYRKMAEDCVNRAASLAGLEKRSCVTRTLHIHGHHERAEAFGGLAFYGSDAPAIERLIQASPELGRPLHDALPIQPAQVIHAVRQEMARTLDDVLARRTRCLQLNARAALAVAPTVATLMAEELGEDLSWQESQLQDFHQIARGYLLP